MGERVGGMKGGREWEEMKGRREQEGGTEEGREQEGGTEEGREQEGRR